jgi:hypothetical protein
VGLFRFLARVTIGLLFAGHGARSTSRRAEASSTPRRVSGTVEQFRIGSDGTLDPLGVVDDLPPGIEGIAAT